MLGMGLDLSTRAVLKRGAAAAPTISITAGPDANGSVTTPSAGVREITKTGGGGAFNAGFYGDAKTGDFRYSLTIVATQDTMIGYTTGNPAAASDFADMAKQVYITGGSNMSAYDGPTAGAALGPYLAGDIIWLDRTGTTVTFKLGATYAGAATLRSIAGVAGTIYLDISMFTVGAVIDIALA